MKKIKYLKTLNCWFKKNNLNFNLKHDIRESDQLKTGRTDVHRPHRVRRIIRRH